MNDRLPIYDIESEIISRLRADRRLILSAPTGSGKSTQVPQMLLQAGLLGEGQVVILQPRRLAARLLATRVAQELGVKLGREVGYQIRFENVTSPETKIRFVTEGVLLRQMIDDPQLKGVSVLLFDEFHERHLYGDITLARALDVQESSRPDLRIGVMSATLDTDLLAFYLKPKVLTSEGRTFPVEIKYAADPSYSDKRPIWDQAADAFSRYVRSGGQGDVLVFMPGGFEISQTIEAIRHTDEAKGFILLPLHGELPPNDQDAAVARYPQRKVVVSTNVAETSLTIDGMRLWSREEHSHRPAQELPEIKRLDLAEVVLTLKAAGVANLRKFRWLEPPDEQSLAHAEELLTDLGALQRRTGVSPVCDQSATKKNNGDRQDACPTMITEVGRKMLAFPIHPRYARMLLAAQEYGCVYQAALVAALTQGRDLLLRNVGRDTNQLREDLLGEKASSDFWILMRAWTYAAKNQFRLDACRKLGIHAVTARQVGPLFDHFLRIAKKEGLNVEPREVKDEALQKCVLIGFSDRVAHRLDQGTLRCELVHNRRGVLARESVVQHANLFVAAEVREVEGKDEEVRTILSLATAIEVDWLRELFPEDIEGDLKVQFDPTQKRVMAAELSRFRGLALSARRVEPPPADAAARLLADEVVAGHL